MKNYNITIKAVTFLLLISLFSCKPKEQGLDSKVRNLIESSSSSLLYSKYSSPFIIDRIVYDTIGTGDWSYNIAELMINNPQAFSDKTLFNELLDARQQIDTNDHNIRLIANIYGHYENNVDNFWNDNIFYIGIIGDSLTDVEKKPINALLNICSDEESNIIDVSNVIGLSDRRISSCMNKTIKKALSEKNYYGYDDKFSNKMKHSKIHSIFDDKGKVKDTIVHLQFMGICLNESIDSVILKHPNYSIVKDYSFNNYSCYHLKNKIEIKSNKYLVETQLYTIDNQIALIKAVCFDNIFEELYEMFKTKYGEDIYAYPDETFFNIVTGAHVYSWSFANNGIILVYNNEQHDVYHTVYDYRKNLWYTYYTFKNITIVYCDKQLYRRLLQKENERKSSVEREQFVSDSLKKVEKHRKDSIQKANEKERLIRNSTQI